MEIFELSGVGDKERIGIEGIGLDDYRRLSFLNPDEDAFPASDARRKAASQWPGLKLIAVRPRDRRIEPYFTDAIGPGLMIPGCGLAISQRARDLLSEILSKEALFLPVEISGAPFPYWLLYAVEYCSDIDVERSDFTGPYRSATDRRAMLRRPTFKASADVSTRLVFRIPSNLNFIASDVTYATERFLELVQKLELGGFTFVKILARERKLDDGEKRAIVSSGPHYVPAHQLPLAMA